MTGLPVLSLHQPWASLIACGEKSIETRPWSTDYRGWLAIHATKQRPETWDYEDGCDFGDAGVMQFAYNREHRWWHYYLDIGGPGVGAAGPFDLPLGTIVATARLVDVVPIFGTDGILHLPDGLAVHRMQDSLWLVIVENKRVKQVVRDVSDQLPYGDYRDGRWAWITEDGAPVEKRCPGCMGRGKGAVSFGGNGTIYRAKPCPTCSGEGHCAPIPFKGGQRLTRRWEP